MPAFSKTRIQRWRGALAGYVERGEVPGLVALLSRRGEVFVEVMGSLSVEHPTPMRRDALFRIASLSKPMTAVAAMILVEEGRLRMDDPVDPWLPELANRRVLRALEGPPEDTVPARRAITARDLLTYRMGFGSVLAPMGTCPIQKLIRDNRIGGDGHPRPAKAPSTEEWMRRLGALPWIAQPGERWLYHVSGDVLGVLIARVAGQSLGTFMRERVFGPLGMKDTGFQVPRGQTHRLTSCYRFDAASGRLELFDGAVDSDWCGEPPMESGGGGLVSTLDDHFAFSQMMLGEGKLGRLRLLSPATVALMTSDQLAPAERAGAELFFGTSRSWGMGMAVDLRRDEIFRTPGRFGWDGGMGTTAYVDPAEGVIGILFTERMMESPRPPRVFTDFWNLGYAAMV